MLKRLFDIVATLVVLLLATPLILTVAFLVAVIIGRPVFFSQTRPGMHGKVFRVFKFRTMSDARSDSGELLPDDVRLCAFGRFLRSTSLDELPSLWNVLRGDMSLVGPRPLLVEYLPLYSTRQQRRHEVRPGVTVWAQVNGRNTLSWEEKFELDIWYVEHKNFALDMKILFLTVLKVLKRDGISAKGEATMPAFTGSADES